MAASLELEFGRKLETVTAGLPREFSGLLQNKIPKEDAMTVIDYIISLKAEINPSGNYRRDIVKCLTRFIAFCHKEREAKKLKQLDRKDVLAFLDSLRKSGIVDPLHKWIGTYNLYRIYLIRFFKW